MTSFGDREQVLRQGTHCSFVAVMERMQLRMPAGGSSGKPYPMGDSSFSSDDPRWADPGIAVGGIDVGFSGEDDL